MKRRPQLARRASASLLVAALLLLLLPVAAKATAPPFANALRLDGADDYANVSDNATLDLGDTDGEDFTIEAFFYVPKTTNGTHDTIFYKQDAYALFINFNTTSADEVFFRWWTGPSASDSLFGTASITAGWHHIAAVYDNEFTASSDRVGIYLDGAQLADNSGATDLTPGIENSTDLLSVGANSGGAPFDGWLEEARFSDTVRYSGSYAVPPSAFSTDASTRALWHFDEAALSTSFADSSANGNTLTGQNGAQTSSGAYARPKGASRIRASLVPAFNHCVASNRTHGPPLEFGSCNPPAQTSGNVTVGTPDANSAPANSIGSVSLKVVVGVPGPPDDSNVTIVLDLSDVRCKAGVAPCGSANAVGGPDYTGQLQGTWRLRITDKFSAPAPGGGSDPATGRGISFPFTATCAGTASTAIGGACGVSTSVNALAAGAVTDGKRAIWQLGQIQVRDGGPDGVVSSSPNDLFAVQGVFVP